MSSLLVVSLALLATPASYPADSPFDAPWFERAPTGHSMRPQLTQREVAAAGFLVAGLTLATGGVVFVLELLHAGPFAYLPSGGFEHLASSLVLGVGGAVALASCFVLAQGWSRRAPARVSWRGMSVVF